MSFPYSNHSYIQLFPAQNQEALFQGMKNIFEYIGKVPKEIWFDNLSADAILTIFHRYLDCEFSFEELDELPRNTPNIQQYDIDLERYNKFLGGI